MYCALAALGAQHGVVDGHLSSVLVGGLPGPWLGDLDRPPGPEALRDLTGCPAHFAQRRPADAGLQIAGIVPDEKQRAVRRNGGQQVPEQPPPRLAGQVQEVRGHQIVRSGRRFAE